MSSDSDFGGFDSEPMISGGGDFLPLPDDIPIVDKYPAGDGGEIVVGSPGTSMQQTTSFTCAVVSQEMILHDFGINVSESQLVYDAATNGWLTDNGTSIADMGNLLEYYGVSTHTNYNGDVPAIINELAHGHKVIVPVNSDELWNGVSFWQKLTGQHNTGADHAIVVAGLNFTDPNNPQVIVNDPGHPDGAGMTYPLERFLEAWNDSNCMYVATDNAPPNLENDALLGNNFNSTSGMYGSEEFWINIGAKIAGDVVKELIKSYFLDETNLTESYGGFSSVLENFDDNARNQLFLQI
jgi:hypothetical protein